MSAIIKNIKLQKEETHHLPIHAMNIYSGPNVLLMELNAGVTKINEVYILPLHAI